MVGNILQAARADAAKFVSAGGFQVSAVLSTPDGLTQLPVTGLGTGTWMVFDNLQSGKPVESSSNSFSISIGQLIAGSYPYLKNDRVYVKGHQVIVSDGAGMAGTFVITEQHPNATLGLIVCIISRKT